MHRIATMQIDQVMPSKTDVLRAQGVPTERNGNRRNLDLAAKALAEYRKLARPQGIMISIAPDDFTDVYWGRGDNAALTPLAGIYPMADSLALYAVTVGQDVCDEISRLFDSHDFAAGTMLDAAASEGAELAGQAITAQFVEYLKEENRFPESSGALTFSPGYCGWHVSGQKALFDFLIPEEIGIQLSESFLMQPLKSTSGVIVAGPREIFAFDDDFPFCRECRTHSCRKRIRSLCER